MIKAYFLGYAGKTCAAITAVQALGQQIHQEK